MTTVNEGKLIDVEVAGQGCLLISYMTTSITKAVQCTFMTLHLQLLSEIHVITP